MKEGAMTRDEAIKTAEQLITILREEGAEEGYYQNIPGVEALQTLLSLAQRPEVVEDEMYGFLIEKLPMGEYLSMSSHKIKELAQTLLKTFEIREKG